ncbi:MAG: patatin-like phospholipase family protein [Betaproteobacteria bacterium]|nr:patatin-like phospholipase family protein [Betaproteobacteria bacterium]
MLCSLIVSIVCGCTTMSRNEAPPVLGAAPAGFPPEVRTLSLDRRSAWASSPGFLAGLRAASIDGRTHILALSGGGAGGAFGAGALVGLSDRGERPQFELVTGVSTGALIAPFAFLGPAWDPQLIEAAMTAGAASMLQWRGGIVFNPAVYSGEPLAAFVERTMTRELFEAVAREARKGRVLLVATTDLDKEETVIWNLGAIAARGGDQAYALFKNVLVASSSIPGLFPPVMIRVEQDGKAYDEMHVDGGTTQSFFIGPQINQYLPQKIDGLENAAVYVLVNGQIGVSPHTTTLQPLPILSRSFAATMRHISRTDISVAIDFARRNGMEFRFTVIPASYPFLGPLSFETSSIQSLFSYGRRCAASGRLWSSIERAFLPLREVSEGGANNAQEPDCPGER